MNQPLIWVLADDRAGNRAQAIGIAERTGLPFVTQEIRYNAFAWLPNIVRGRILTGIAETLKAPWPDIVISAGRRSAPVARFIKHKNGGRTRLIHCLWPDSGIRDFDCIVLPEHDDERRKADNIVRVLGAPHLVTQTALLEAAQRWQNSFAHLPVPRVAVLVGGDTKDCTYAETDYRRLGALAAETTRMHHAAALITTSRRTGAVGERALMANLLNLPHHAHRWHAASKQENPYMGYLGLADAIIVTADSIVMCSEACATGKPVYVFQPNELSNKHRRFLETLYQRGFARPLREDTLADWFRPPAGVPLDAAAEIAQLIRKKWL